MFPHSIVVFRSCCTRSILLWVQWGGQGQEVESSNFMYSAVACSAPDCSNESERRRRRNYPPFIAANKRKLFHQSTCIGQKDWGRGEYVLCFPFFKENEEAARHGVVIIPGRSGQAGIPNNDYRHIRSIDPIWTGIRKGISAALHV